MREALEAVIDEVLRPLLRADQSDVELVGVDADVVRVRLSGEAAYGAGAHYVRAHVLEPALRKVAGSELRIEYDRAVPRPAQRPAPKAKTDADTDEARLDPASPPPAAEEETLITRMPEAREDDADATLLALDEAEPTPEPRAEDTRVVETPPPSSEPIELSSDFLLLDDPDSETTQVVPVPPSDDSEETFAGPAPGGDE